jgi:flavodoxin
MAARALVAFFSKTGRTESIAMALAKGLAQAGCIIETLKISAAQKRKNSGNKKKTLVRLGLRPEQLDLGAFDIVCIGSPVQGMAPKRKISPETEAFIKKCHGLDGKKVAVFVSCFGIPGTTIKRMAALLQTRGALVVGSLAVPYLLSISKKDLDGAEEFAKAILSKKALLQGRFEDF